MIKRYLFIFFTLYCFSSNAQAKRVSGLGYLRHEFKVWLWDDSFQVQITHPKTKSMALVFVRYDVVKSKSSSSEKYQIVELEVETEGKEGHTLHPSIGVLEEIPEAISAAIKGAALSNVISINFYGPRNFEFKEETSKKIEPVFLPLEYVDLAFINKRAPAPTPKEVDIYRFQKLVAKVLSSENLSELKRYLGGDQNLTCSGFLK